MQQKAFFKKLTYFTAILAILLGLVQLMKAQYAPGNPGWAALAYYYLLSLATGTITHSGLKKDNKTFITRTYSAIGIRFIFSICPLLIYLLFSPEKHMPFIVAYVLLYFLYTSFEIYFLVVNLRPDFKKPEA